MGSSGHVRASRTVRALRGPSWTPPHTPPLVSGPGTTDLRISGSQDLRISELRILELRILELKDLRLKDLRLKDLRLKVLRFSGSQVLRCTGSLQAGYGVRRRDVRKVGPGRDHSTSTDRTSTSQPTRATVNRLSTTDFCSWTFVTAISGPWGIGYMFPRYRSRAI